MTYRCVCANLEWDYTGYWTICSYINNFLISLCFFFFGGRFSQKYSTCVTENRVYYNIFIVSGMLFKRHSSWPRLVLIWSICLWIVSSATLKSYTGSSSQHKPWQGYRYERRNRFQRRFQYRQADNLEWEGGEDGFIGKVNVCVRGGSEADSRWSRFRILCLKVYIPTLLIRGIYMILHPEKLMNELNVDTSSELNALLCQLVGISMNSRGLLLRLTLTLNSFSRAVCISMIPRLLFLGRSCVGVSGRLIGNARTYLMLVVAFMGFLMKFDMPSTTFYAIGLLVLESLSWIVCPNIVCNMLLTSPNQMTENVHVIVRRYGISCLTSILFALLALREKNSSGSTWERK